MIAAPLLAAMLSLASPACLAQAAAQPLKPTLIRSGYLIYIMSQVPARVEIDGQTAGEAPMLLNLSGLKSAKVRILSDSAEDSLSVEVDQSQSAIGYYKPDYKAFSGVLIVRGAVPGSVLSVDDRPAAPIVAAGIRLATGGRSLRIDAPGMATLLLEATLERDKETVVSVKQVPGRALVLDPAPPAGTRVEVPGSPGRPKVSFAYGEAFLLPAGKSSLVLSAPGFPGTYPLEADPSAGAVPSPLPAGKGAIALPRSLPKGTAIIVDGAETDAKARTVAVDRGPHTVALKNGDSLPFIEFVFVESGQTVALGAAPSGIRLPESAGSAKARNASFWTFLGSGLATAVVGLVLNADEVAAGMSPDYGTYSTIKYASLGVVGLGAALMGSSLFFTERK
jgi:hypothetical protein